jgi:hypothetical protein
MLFVYDLDGTLVDSGRAVLEAYRAAGLEPPQDFWGKPFSAWSDDWRAHDRKNELYPEMLQKYGKRLPCADLMEITGGHILTGASREATLYALQFLNLSSACLGIYHGCDDAEKFRRLEQLRRFGEGIYVDDDFRFCRRVKEMTEWTVLHVL